MQSLHRHRTARGFTLLELVVVIVILAILAGLAVPRYLRTVNRARAQEALNIMNQVREACEIYALRYGTYATITPVVNTDFTLGNTNLVFDPLQVSGTPNFTYRFTALVASAYTLQATATNGAGTISLTNDGIVTGTGQFTGL